MGTKSHSNQTVTYETLGHECDKDCCFLEEHQCITNTPEPVIWKFQLPQYDEHVIDWVLSKCRCEDCILENFFVPWLTERRNEE